MFTIEEGTVEFNGSTTATAAANLTVDNSGNVVLAEGAEAGTYTATVYYEDNEGDTFVQRMDIIVSEVGIRGEGADGAGTAADTFAQVTQNNPSPAPTSIQVESQQVAGVSTINIEEARQGTIKSIGTGRVLNDAFNTFVGNNTGGTFALSGDDAELFTIDASSGDVATKGLVDYESKTSYSFNVVYTAANNSTYTEGVTLRVGDNDADNDSHITNVDLGTQAGAANAVNILDTAINQISSSQAKLGAIQNRLQYNIDNLSKATMLTQTAKGRIMDADFAAETSELSKQQILSQAATSMLAQANQSKQSVLALLQ
jgi:flagellin